MADSPHLVAHNTGLLDVPCEELLDEFVSGGVAELRSAMPSALDDVQRRFQSHFLIQLVDMLALAEWHQFVLVTVEDENGRIVLREIGDGAGGFEEFRRLVGAEVVALLGEQVEGAGAKQIDDGVDLGRLIEVSTHITFEFFYASAQAEQQHQVPASGAATHSDACHVVSVLLGVGTQPPDGPLAVVDLFWV